MKIVDERAKIPIPPKQDLEAKYVRDKMTTTQIGNYYHVSGSLVSRWLRKLGIKRPKETKVPITPAVKSGRIAGADAKYVGKPRRKNVGKPTRSNTLQVRSSDIHKAKLPNTKHSLVDVVGAQEMGSKDYRFNPDDFKGQGEFDFITPFGVDDLSTYNGEFDTDGRYYYDDEYFDSSWELAYYVYNIDHEIEIEHNPTHFVYMVDDEEHVYVPDFRTEDTLVEISSKQRIKALRKSDVGKARYKCMTDNKVNILTYVDVKPCIEYVNSTYGEDFLYKYRLDDEEGS